MGAGQSKSQFNEKIFSNETAISVSQDVINQLSDRLHSGVNLERQSSIDAHIQSRIQAELDYLRKEEQTVRQEIEFALQRENLDRERAMTGDVHGETEDASSTVGSGVTLLGDVEQIRTKIERFHSRRKLEQRPEVEEANRAVLACYESNQGKSLNCWQRVKLFKKTVASMEEEYLKTL